MEALDLITLAGGLVVLSYGADRLVDGASALARRWGVPAVVVGLTIVSFGTSAPEMAVSVVAALRGSPDLAVSNVVGSNIFNVLFILGLCALFRPLVVHSRMVRIDVPVIIALSLLTWFFALDGRISVLEAALFVSGMIGYMLFTLKKSASEPADVREEFDAAIRPKSRPAWFLGLQVLLSLGLLVLGTRWFVDGAVNLAQALGISETVIGLTIVAAGTSMPEVFTSVVATMKGERDIAVGNVVGSNIFNLLGILGVSGLIAGGGGLKVDPSLAGFDIPVMCAVAAACLPIFWSGHAITRREGAVFFVYYLIYTAYIVLTAQQHAALARFGLTVLIFVVPITLLTVASGLVRSGGARQDR